MRFGSQELFRSLRRGLALGLALVLAGCSWLQDLEIDPTRDWSANKLYSEARSALHDGNWDLAKNYYTKLESRYPFGAYAQQAQIDLAYVLFQDDDATTAVQTLDRFLRAYPNHPHSDYALYLKALATLNERPGLIARLIRRPVSERDEQSARDAFDIFKELAGRFPDSRYATEARRRMHQLINAQATYELSTAKFYYARKAYMAAAARAQTVVTDFQQTAASDEALRVMADCYRELGLTQLEADTRRIIEQNGDRRLN